MGDLDLDHLERSGYPVLPGVARVRPSGGPRPGGGAQPVRPTAGGLDDRLHARGQRRLGMASHRGNRGRPPGSPPQVRGYGDRLPPVHPIPDAGSARHVVSAQIADSCPAARVSRPVVPADYLGLDPVPTCAPGLPCC